MALTPDELRQLKETLSNSIEDGFEKIKHNTQYMFDDNGNLIEDKDQIKNILETRKKEEIREQQGKEKFAKINKIVKNVIGIAEGIVEIIVAVGEKEIAYTKASLDKNVKITQVNLQKQTQSISQGMRSITSSFTKNAVDVSYDFVQASYDIAKTAYSSSMEFKIAEKTYNKAINEANKNFMSSIGDSAIAIGAGIGTLIAPGIGTAIGSVVGGIFSMWNKLWGLDIQRQNLAIDQMEQVKNIMGGYQDAFKQITQQWDDLAKQSTDFALKLNDSGLKFSRTIGYTSMANGKTDDFSSALIKMSQETMANGKTMAEVFGNEIEKLPQIMDSYIQTSSRAVNLSAKDYGNIMGTGRLFGMSSEEASVLYGSMNIFNASISSASDSMGVMYHQITKMGLSSKKFGKDLVENLKLAQKYNFKGGVDNMMKLTKWAQQTRFNLNSAASFADSILDGSLSDALEKSARLQVLGGAAAIYSDPFGMLYDAGANVGDLAKRQAAMFSDLTGTFNSKTGETEFSWYENKMIRERAKAAGLNVEDVFNQIRQTNKQGVIDKLLGGMDEEDRIAIGNRATYNQDKRRWEVTDIRGDTHDIQDYANGNANIEDLLPVDTQEAILTVSEKSLSHLENLDGAVVGRMTKLSSEKLGTIYKTSDTINNMWKQFYRNNWTGVSDMWEMVNEQTINLAQENINLMTETMNNREIVENIYAGNLKAVSETINSINGDLLYASRAYRGGFEAFKEYAENKLNNKEQNNEKVKERGERIARDCELLSKSNISIHLMRDGVGSTNGGVMFGASNVRPINDGEVNVGFAKQDQYLAAMPNGPIDKILQQLIPGLQALIKGNGSTGGSLNLNVNGKIDLEQDSSSLNLVDMIKNNPNVASQILSIIKRTMDVNSTGKPIKNYM